MKLKRKVGVILFTLMIIQFVFLNVNVLAKENKVVTNVVKNIKIHQIGALDKSKTFEISGNWSIEDNSVKEGDTFILGFSDNINLSRLRGNLPLIGSDGSVYAIGKLDKVSKKIVFTFTDKVEKEINIHGNFGFEGLLLDIENPDPDRGIEREKIKISEENGKEFEREVEFNNAGYIVGGEVVVPGDPNRELNYDKVGQIHPSFNDVMYWYVYVNGRSETKRYDKVIEVYDELKPGHSIVGFDEKEADFTITVTDEANNNDSGIVVYSKGKIIDKEIFDMYIKDFKYSTKGYSLKFNPSGGGKGIKALRIYYHTKIDEDADFDQTVFQNEVDIGADDGFKTKVPQEVDFGSMTGSGYGDGYKDGQVNIHKVDNEGNPIKIEGIQFKVEKHQDYPAPNSMHFNGIYTTDKNGIAKIDRLFAGVYKVTELNTPDGYIMNTDPKVMIVNFSAIEDYNREIEYAKMDIDNLKTESSYNNNCEDSYYKKLIEQKEKDIKKAEKNIEKSKNKGIEFKFTNIPKENVEYKVNKIWDIKGEDKDLKSIIYLRRTSITYDDLGNLKVDTIDLDDTRKEILYSDDIQEIVWSGLDKFNDDGEAYVYTVQEETSDRLTIKREVNGDVVNITNTDEAIVSNEKIELEVEKKWINIDEEMVPVDNIEIDVLKNGEYYISENISKANNWKSIIKDLDKYEKIGKEIKEIEYSVVETPIRGFTSSITKIENKFIIENKAFNQSPIDIQVDKIWQFNNGEYIPDKLIPDLLTLDLLANDKIISSEIFKKDEDGKFNIIFENMPKYDKYGKEIIYSIKERGHDNFRKEILKNSNTSFTIKNILEDESVSLDVKKVWKDKNNKDIDGDNNLLPNRIGVEVLMNDDSYLVGILTKDNDWTISFNNLPKYNELGEEVKYSIKEIILKEDEPIINSSIIEATDNNFIITNKIEFDEPIPPKDKETIEINIEKNWQMGEEQADIEDIPNIDIIVQIIGDGIVLREDSLSKETDWKLTVRDLPKFNENKEKISYEVKELNWDKKSEVTKDGNIFYITNYLDSEEETPEHPKEKVSIEVNKFWNDDDGNEVKDIPVDKVSMELYADGVFLKDFQVSRENDWITTIDGLNKFNENKELIKYEIKEVDFNGRVIEISNGKYEVINTIDKPEIERATKSIDIEKLWKDKDGESLETIPVKRVRVEILRNEEPYLIVLLDESNDWKLKVDHLYVNDKEGNEYKYSIKEMPLESFTDIKNEVEYIQEGKDKFIIINKIEGINKPIETIDIPVEKVWINQSGETIEEIRDNYIQVKLLRNGKDYLTGLLSKDNQWKGSFENLMKTDIYGNPYSYTIEEIPVLGYVSKVEGDMDTGYKIINQIRDVEKRSIPLKKKWVASIGSSLIPEHIDVDLYKDGEFFRTGRILKSENWEGMFTNLDKHRIGEDGREVEIVYSIKEIEEEGYSSLISGAFRKGYDIYNVEEYNMKDEDLIDIPIKKIWRGGNESLTTIILYANGVEINRVNLNAQKLDHTFKNLPKYDNDKEIDYSIEEIEIKGYEQNISGDKVNGYIITNTKIDEVESEDPVYPVIVEKPKDPNENNEDVEKPKDPNKDNEDVEKPKDPNKDNEDVEKPKDSNKDNEDVENIKGNNRNVNKDNILPKTGYNSMIITELLGLFLVMIGVINYSKNRY